jgi:hypothetical protein
VLATETHPENGSVSAERNTMSATGETALMSDERESPKVVAIHSYRHHRPRLLLPPQPQLLHRLQLPTTLPSSPSASTANDDTKTTTERRYLLASHLLLRAAAMSDRVTTSTAMPNVAGTQYPRKLPWTLTKNTADASNKKQSVLAAALATRTATLTVRRVEGARRMSVTGPEVPKTAHVRLLLGIVP